MSDPIFKISETEKWVARLAGDEAWQGGLDDVERNNCLVFTRIQLMHSESIGKDWRRYARLRGIEHIQARGLWCGLFRVRGG